MAVRALDGAVLMGDAAVVARGLHAVVGAQRVVVRGQVVARALLEVTERRRQAVAAVLAWGAAQGPQGVLQPLGQRDVALATQDDVRMFEARAGEAEVVQPMIQTGRRHRDAQAVHLGEVGQAHATRLVHLAEDDVTIFAMDGAPTADAPFNGAANAGRQLRMAPHQLLEHRHWPHARCRLQQRHHFGVEDLGQRIRPASLAWRLLLRRQPRVLLEAIGRGDAEPGTGGRLRRPFGQSELHVEPHLVVVDVSSGHGQALENEIPAPYPIHRDYRRGPNGGPLRRARGREGSGLRPAPSRPRGSSHPD